MRDFFLNNMDMLFECWIIISMVIIVILGIMQWNVNHMPMSDEQILARQDDEISPELKKKLDEAYVVNEEFEREYYGNQAYEKLPRNLY